ncbi:MAG: 30S ribosomal protein S3 [SAR202 cluster bacterium]|nr:30S ribosomal protein S3 [SAR202 cluster bacterium]
MGHKTHPIGFRLGVVAEWQARWYARPQTLRNTLQEDFKLRKAVQSFYPEAGISRVDIERSAQEATVTIWTARPGIIIGRQGQRVDELRKRLEPLTAGRVRVAVQEVRQPELDAALVARNVAEQLERRVGHRRAMVQTASRTMQAGGKGIRIICKGRLGGAEIARREKVMMGRVPLHTLRADIDFAVAEAHTVMGRIGVRVWLYKGEILPAGAEAARAERATPQIQVTVMPDQPEPAESSNAST